jgi:hypothetical protein
MHLQNQARTNRIGDRGDVSPVRVATSPRNVALGTRSATPMPALTFPCGTALEPSRNFDSLRVDVALHYSDIKAPIAARMTFRNC